MYYNKAKKIIDKFLFDDWTCVNKLEVGAAISYIMTESIPREKIDEMIAEIESAKRFWGDYKRTSLSIEMEDIIHKYCDKENK